MIGGIECSVSAKTEGEAFSFVVVLKPASGMVLISGGLIGTHEIPIASAQSLFDGLHDALVAIPAIAKAMAQ